MKSSKQPTSEAFLWTLSVHLRDWRCDLSMGSAAISLSAALGFMSELITLNRFDEGSQRGGGHPYHICADKSRSRLPAL